MSENEINEIIDQRIGLAYNVNPHHYNSDIPEVNDLDQYSSDPEFY